MDFTIPRELIELQQRTRTFIAEHVIPMENDQRCTPHGPTDDLCRELMAKGKQAGLLSCHVSGEYGGLGLSHLGKAIVFEEAGYSPLGPVALNIFAPDEGNMHMMEEICTAEQKERWLRPLAAGELRSCFAMSEPPPGAGSDPSMLQTTAVRDGKDFVINGVKWFITGADGASVAIIMAKLDGGGPTMFLSDMNAPGIALERTMDALDTCFAGGHGVLRFDNVRVPEKNVLGAPGEGFKYAQVRLSPARLAHCMRWLGAARRAHDVATRYAISRQAFGKQLGSHEGIGFMLADNDMDLHITRLAVWHCAWVLDQGNLGTRESSAAKVITSEAIWRTIDRSVQILGGQGVTHETIVARIFADARSFRIYDGPSETHRWSIAKHILRNVKVI